MRRLTVFGFVSLFLSTAASAQTDSKGNISFGSQGLFGGAPTSASGTGFSNSDTSLGTALGGGVDFRLAQTIGWRVQSDYLQTRFFGSVQNNFRFSTGVVVRF